MICPTCKSEGKKSCVYGGDMGMTTLMYCAPYYDEDGAYHHHDHNSTAYTMRCSNGHEWTEVTYPKCPSCGWSRAA